MNQQVKEEAYFICQHGKKTSDINVSGMSATLNGEVRNIFFSLYLYKTLPPLHIFVTSDR